MKKIATLAALSATVWAFAQFTSPGNGTTYTLNTLSAAAPTVLVSNGAEGYTLTDNLTLSAGDALEINENTTLKIAAGKQLNIAGNYTTTDASFTVTGTDASTLFKGIVFEATASAEVKNTIFEYGGGIRVSTGNFLMDNCIVRYFKSGLVTGSALSFSTGTPVVQNSQFIENDLPAFSSGANLSVAITIQNNYLYGNTKLNSNRPQINMGPSGSGTTKVLNNTIIGNRDLTVVGGVSVSSLLGVENHVQMENNTIRDNRYGITITGSNSTGNISKNIIENNNTETNPQNGGSGISLYGAGTNTVDIVISENQIRGNLWGITLIGTAKADLGSDTNVGNNIFKDNGNGGNTYALYNNTANPVSAVNNCWREGDLSTDEMVGEVIWDSADDPALGTVNYTPYQCGVLAVSDVSKSKIQLYPNPSSNGVFTLEVQEAGNYIITDLSGKLLFSGLAAKGKNKISHPLSAGMYLCIFQGSGQQISQKIIIK